MAKKNLKPDEEPKFIVKKRVPKEKPDFFQNIPDIKSRLHPLADVFEFPSGENPTDLTLDSQKKDELHFLAIQNQQRMMSKESNLGYPVQDDLDSQENLSSHSEPLNTDSQSLEIGYPKNEELDSQNRSIVNPKNGNLDSNISKQTNWIAKDAEKSNNLDSDLAAPADLEIQKSEKKGKWRKYDKKR